MNEDAKQKRKQAQSVPKDDHASTATNAVATKHKRNKKAKLEEEEDQSLIDAVNGLRESVVTAIHESLFASSAAIEHCLNPLRDALNRIDKNVARLLHETKDGNKALWSIEEKLDDLSSINEEARDCGEKIDDIHYTLKNIDADSHDCTEDLESIKKVLQGMSDSVNSDVDQSMLLHSIDQSLDYIRKRFVIMAKENTALPGHVPAKRAHK